MTRWNQRSVDSNPRLDRIRLRLPPKRPDPLTQALRLSLHFLLRGFLRGYHRLNISGAENFPLDRSFVIVANHTSHLDALCLLSSLPLKRVHSAFPAAAADYFFSSLPRAFLSSILMNGLPFDRQGGAGESLMLCRQLLSGRRNVLILFPEGTRSLTGETQRFRAGVAHLVGGSKIPVVPCYLAGAFSAWPKGQWFPKPHALELRVGTPRTFEAVEVGRPGAVRRICRELQEAVEALRPPELDADTAAAAAGMHTVERRGSRGRSFSLSRPGRLIRSVRSR